MKKGEFAKDVWKKHTDEWEISKRVEMDEFEREIKGRMKRLLKKKKKMNGISSTEEIKEEIIYESFVPLNIWRSPDLMKRELTTLVKQQSFVNNVISQHSVNSHILVFSSGSLAFLF